MALSKAEIDAIDDVIVESLHVPEWDIKNNGKVVKKGEVFIRVLAGTDKDTIERDWIVNEKKMGEGMPLEFLRVRYAAMCLCDVKGERLYADNETGKLGKRSSAAIERIFDAGQKLNADTPEAAKELGKNSDGDQND